MHLRLENVTKRFDGRVAVDSLSLEVPPGVIFGIIGPNGAGKTTTIRMILNIIAPDEGQVYVNGRPADGSFRDRVGYLPEERGLYKKMTLREVIVYMAELKGYPRRQAEAELGAWLERMELAAYLDRKVEELSKGMAQKLQFVTTILHKPEFVILDELFSGLDPLNVELIKNILLELRRGGTTILFSTHVMEQAEKLCDHICMISHGKKVLDGTISDIKSRFGHNSVRINFAGDASFIRSLPGVRAMTEFTNYVELDLDGTVTPPSLLREIAGRVEISRFEVMEPSLYDIFIDLARVDPLEVRPAGGRSDG